MKLATLTEPVKAAYRAGEIDTTTGEAFASVPAEKQLEVWRELNGHPRHAEHVRNIIANGWIDSSHALFDVSTFPETAVSRDLFSERVLVERQVFMDAQTQALGAMHETLKEEGWAEAVRLCVGQGLRCPQSLAFPLKRPQVYQTRAAFHCKAWNY